MIPLYSTDQIRKLDADAINNAGIPSSILMENAAINIASVISEQINHFNLTGTIGIVCGKGNNGGDGFAAGRHLINKGYTVKFISMGSRDEMSVDCRLNYDILSSPVYKAKVKFFSSAKDINFLAGSAIIIDAILGSGAKGKLTEPLGSVIKKLNEQKAYKVAIDIPTGLDSDKGFGEIIFNADLTITLAGYKKGLFFNDGYAYAGDIIKEEIGVKSEVLTSEETDEYLVEPEDVFYSLPSKGKNLHKYSAGKVLMISGSIKLPGAGILSSKGVFSIGAGACVLAFPKKGRRLITSALHEVVLETYGEEEEFLNEENVLELKKRITWADVVAIGSGIERNESTLNAVVKIISENPKTRFVIDADALFALKDEKYRKLNFQNSILTPHHAEFANLINIEVKELQKDLLAHGKNFAVRNKCILVLKGAPTIIFNSTGQAFINTTGNPGLAKFGSGDVLTGVIAGLYAQLRDPETAAINGVYLHSLAADLVKTKLTEYSYTASDLIKYIPQSIQFLRNSFV